MKTASPTLIANLLNNSQFYRADLYTLTLLDGTVLRYTTWDKQITTLDARVFNPGTPNIKRTNLSSKVGLEVSTLNIEFQAVDTDPINGIPAMQLIAKGGFSGAIVQLETAVMLSPGDTSAGTVMEFIGEMAGADEIGRSAAKFTVNALTNRLSQQVPRKLIQMSCGNTLFDAGCGLVQSSFAVNGTVAPGSTPNKILATTNLNTTAEYFALGKVQFTSGVGAGKWFGIRHSVTGILYPVRNMGFDPQAGDTFTAYPGCDKLQATCNTKFVNIANFDGKPYVPEPEKGI